MDTAERLLREFYEQVNAIHGDDACDSRTREKVRVYLSSSESKESAAGYNIRDAGDGMSPVFIKSAPPAPTVQSELPEEPQHIVFEGCDCVVMAPEDYEALCSLLAQREERIRELENEIGTKDQLLLRYLRRAEAAEIRHSIVEENP